MRQSIKTDIKSIEHVIDTFCFLLLAAEIHAIYTKIFNSGDIWTN